MKKWLASEKFVCIADESKVVKQLGAFPLPLEVIPMAVSSVSRAMEDLGGHPVVRDFITDNGNNIIDVHGLQIKEPQLLENAINKIPGVVTCGIFANRGTDVLLVASEAGIKDFKLGLLYRLPLGCKGGIFLVKFGLSFFMRPILTLGF